MTCLTCAVYRSGTVASKLYLGNPLNITGKGAGMVLLKHVEKYRGASFPFFSCGALQAFITPFQWVQVWGGEGACAGKYLCVLGVHTIHGIHTCMHAYICTCIPWIHKCHKEVITSYKYTYTIYSVKYDKHFTKKYYK